MSALEDRLRRFAYEWHEAMNSPYAVNMMPLLLEAASDIRSLAAPSLESENAKLREIIADLEELLPESGRWYSHETVKAISEDNAKLRKLLLDVWNDAMQFDGFWDYVNDDGEIYNEDELPHYYDRMRELGLEVE